jgi:hypothetical protein
MKLIPKMIPFLLIVSIQISFGQDLLGLLGDKALQGIGARGTKLMEGLDSVDFQFAISMNENAGFFDIEQKGETWKQIMYQQKAQQDKTLVDVARDTVLQGVELYSIRRYERAERAFVSSKRLLESRGLTNSLVYLRAASNLGLIYLTQGEKRITLVEIIPGKGSGALKKSVLRFLERKEIKKLYHRLDKDSKNFGRLFVHFRF